MQADSSSTKRDRHTPWYGQVWAQVKRFPGVIAAGNQKPPIASGLGAAALLSAPIGCAAMMIAHQLADTSKDREAFIYTLGHWIPGSRNPDPMWGSIGSYSGKETILLIGWLVSWLALGLLWRGKSIRTRTLFLGMLGLGVLATAMCWHPLFPYLPLM
jgi:hypothetical protein